MRRRLPSAPDLSLAPILNIVVILIPMLLLAVAFLSVGIVNVSTPQLIASKKSNIETEPAPVIAISASGFVVQQSGDPIRIPVKNQEKVDRLLAALEDTQNRVESLDRIERLTGSYDYDALYESVAVLNNHATAYSISADPNLPFPVVVRTMDAVRHRVDRKNGKSIWESKRTGILLTDPTLAIVR